MKIIITSHSKFSAPCRSKITGKYQMVTNRYVMITCNHDVVTCPCLLVILIANIKQSKMSMSNIDKNKEFL